MPSSLGIVNASNHDFSPEDLKPYLWLDATDESTLAFDAGTGAYIDGGLVMFGGGATANNAGIDAPTGSPLDVTGNIDMIVKASASSWSAPGASRFLIARGFSSSSTGYRLILTSGGLLQIQWIDTLSAGQTLSSSIATGLSNGETKWVRGTLNLNNGLGNCVAKFYLSDDGETWTQLGSDVFLGATSTQRTGTAGTVRIGGHWNGSAWSGTIYRAVVKNGIDGPIVMDANFEKVPRHSTSFFEDSTRRALCGLTSSTNGRAVTAISPKYRQYQTTAAEIVNGAGLRLPGTTGNYAISPDSSALDITGDLDIRAQVAFDNWIPSSTQIVVAKFGVGGATLRSYSLGIEGLTGKIELRQSTDGSNQTAILSTTNTQIADGSLSWIRATLDVDNGAAGRTVQFFTSTDGTNWNQLGSDVVVATAAQTFNSTSPLTIGIRSDLISNAVAGTIRRVQIRNGINGTIAFDADFSTQASLTAQFIESSANQAVVTVVSTSQFVQGTLTSMPALGNDPKTGKIGLYFSGGPSLVAQAVADWKFMSDGTQFLVAMVFRIAVADPNTLYVILGTSQGWTVGTIGWWIGYDDRSSASVSNAIRAYIANNTGVTVCSAVSENDQVSTLETHTFGNIFKPLATTNRGTVRINGRQVAVDADVPAPPSASNPFSALTLGRIQSNTFTGTIHELIILSGDTANEESLRQLDNYLTKKYRIGRDRDADWLNGTYTSTATHHVVTFRQPGSFTPLRNLDVEYLVVAGGGGGGSADAAGGGGAGGAVVGSMTMTSKIYAIQVGSGGAASQTGQNSFIGDREIVAYGGGASIGGSGGSGAGGRSDIPPGAGVAGQGYAGGTGGAAGPGSGGGGGGAGGVGANGSTIFQTSPGNGGPGIEWPTGSGVYYASGGGGAGSAGGTGQIGTSIIPGGGGRGAWGATAAESGTANTGGGGGSSRTGSAGAGGSGIVIIRWPKTS